jgi:hypothetical protein
MRVRSRLWIFAVALASFGCQTAPTTQVEDPAIEDDFGEDIGGPINVESVSRDEMVHQRAQLELRAGGQIPFDVFRPDEDASIDPGFGLGAKFAFETAKNVFIGVLVDWTMHDVEDPGEVAGDNQIEQLEKFQKWNILATADYDIPLTDAQNPLTFRVGGAMGLSIIKFDERDTTINTFETFVSFVARPSVGLRLPITEEFLIFGELSYDLIPERSLETNQTAVVTGTRPVFSSGGFWLGLAYEFH